MAQDTIRSWLSFLLQPLLGNHLPIQHILKPIATFGHKDANPVYQTALPAAWCAVDQRDEIASDLDAQHWWNSSGYALSILFDKAGYSSSSQYDLLCFFQSLTRFLGPARVDGKNTWNSFMTDDHNPIELSWDWRTGGKPPKIRLSIEPVGRYAGTERDPNNSKAAKDFRRRLPELVPSTNMAWLAHFQRQLSVGEETVDAATGHSSKEFYAFDLDENGSIISKAYFFPAYKAGVTGLSSLDIVSEAIKSAPESTLDKIQALAIFRDFASDPQLSSLEIELLAIDLVQPAESRFKIYFRIRDTSFASFRHVMTLGNRIVDSPEQGRGLADMEQLYKTLFIPSEFESQWDEHMQLPATNHRTGGFLYFAEFKYGSKWPKVKAYLPVRHYSSSEEATFSALGHYLRGNMFLKDYIAAMRTVFSEDALKTRSGLQTYLGCSIEEGGELRLVSYLNPRETKFADKVLSKN